MLGPTTFKDRAEKVVRVRAEKGGEGWGWGWLKALEREAGLPDHPSARCDRKDWGRGGEGGGTADLSSELQRAKCSSCLGSSATPSDVGSAAPGGGRMVIMSDCIKRL